MLKLKNKKILVTGGRGMIGQTLVPMLKRKGAKVVILSRTNGEDVTNPLSFDFEGIDYVIHMAVCQNSKNNQEYYKVNVKGTRNVIKECIKVGIKRLVYVSTVMVFEDTGNIPRDENYFKRKKYCGNYYADSKIKALKIIKAFKKKLDIVTVYPTIVLTRKTWYKPGSLMSLVGSGNRIVNYVSVERVSMLIIKALIRGKAGDDYILSGKNIRAKDFCFFSFIRLPSFLTKIFVDDIANMCFCGDKLNKLE